MNWVPKKKEEKKNLYCITSKKSVKDGGLSPLPALIHSTYYKIEYKFVQKKKQLQLYFKIFYSLSSTHCICADILVIEIIISYGHRP